MPAYGRVETHKAGIIFPGELPPLPIPIAKGSFSLSLGFEQKPQATLEYEGILQTDIRKFEQIYAEGYLFARKNLQPIKVAGYPFWPVSYTYDRDHSDIERVGRVHIYKVSINLEWAWQRNCEGDVFIYKKIPAKSKSLSLSSLAAYAGVPYRGPSIDLKLSGDGDRNTTMSLDSAVQEHARRKGCFVYYGREGIELRVLGSGNTWTFPTEELLSDGGNTLALPIAYRNASLSYGGEDEGTEDPDGDDATSLKFFRESQKPQIVEEYDENYQHPPEMGSSVLRSLDSNWDSGGPTKTYRRRETLAGQPIRELVQIWGFAYLAKDIHVGGGKLQGVPSQFWRIVEEQKTEYVYKPAPPSVISLYARDPVSGSPLSTVLHPSYQNAPGVSGGGSTSGLAAGTKMSMRSSAMFLSEVMTTGWTLNRFLKEDGDGGEWHSLFDGTPKYSLVHFQEIPKVSGQAFYLESERSLYPQTESVSSPFSVEWTDFASLSASDKSYVRDSSTGLGTNRQDSAGRVGLLTPDLNFVEPYHVMKEITFSSSFAYVPNPEAESAADPTTPETGGESFVREHYLTGDESWTMIERRISPGDPNKYTEKTSEFSARNSNFGDSAAIIQYKDVYGRPPQPTVLQLKWEQRETQPGNKKRIKNSQNENRNYLVTTDYSENVMEGGSFSYGTAANLMEAQIAFGTDLRIAEMQAMQEQKTLTWYYPNLEIGDRLISGDDRYDSYGRWRITQISWSGTVDGSTKWGLSPLCTIEGTQVTCGLDRDRRFWVTPDPNQQENNPAPDGAGGNPDLFITAEGGNAIGKIQSAVTMRRNF
jgi:hypothetical protein